MINKCFEIIMSVVRSDGCSCGIYVQNGLLVIDKTIRIKLIVDDMIVLWRVSNTVTVSVFNVEVSTVSVVHLKRYREKFRKLDDNVVIFMKSLWSSKSDSKLGQGIKIRGSLSDRCVII